MPNGKFKMKYGDSVSPGTFSADAPAQKFAPQDTRNRDTLKPGRSAASYFISDIKGKVKSPGFKKDLAVFGSIAGLTPIGRTALGAKVIGGVVKKSLSNLKSFFKQTKAIKTAKPVTKSVKATTTITKPKNPRIAAKAKGDMSYLSIAKADKSVSKLTAAEQKAFSERQRAYLQQQFKQKAVGSASYRMQRTHQKAVRDFYAGKGPKIKKSFWTGEWYKL